MKTGLIGSIYCYRDVYRDVLSTDIIRKYCTRKECFDCKLGKFWAFCCGKAVDIKMGQHLGLMEEYSCD